MSEPVKLTYSPIAHNIVRCVLDRQACVTTQAIGVRSFLMTPRTQEWNMSATIATLSEIRIGEQAALLRWQDGVPTKVSGDLEIEIERCITDQSVI